MSERLTYLMARWLDGTASKEERKELWGLSLEAANQEQLRTELEGAWSGVPDEQSMSAGKINELFERIGSDHGGGMDVERLKEVVEGMDAGRMEEAVEGMDAGRMDEAVEGRKLPFRRRLLWSAAAAAVVILVIGNLI